MRQTSNDFSSDVGATGGGCSGGSVSEQSTVYWDLSNMSEEGSQPTASGGKFKISLQTIHQKQEMSSGTAATSSKSTPNVSFQARVTRRMATETSSGRSFEYSLPAPVSPGSDEMPSSPVTTSHTTFTITSINQAKPNLMVTLDTAVPLLRENIQRLKASSIPEKMAALRDMQQLIESAWAIPTIGRDLASKLCDVLRADGGLDLLIDNCSDTDNHAVQLGSARLLEQSMTVSNRDCIANRGLEVVVHMAKQSHDDLELTKASTGILESLFKHSENTCSRAIQLGGLDSILYSCRTCDLPTLRHCSAALANLAIFGGMDNQSQMIARKSAEWLFPLAFSQDDSVRYYAFLAIAALSANKELESSVVQSGTLSLVEPFIRNHDPVEFARSDLAHIHGQSSDWLLRAVPMLSSKREEAQSLAAFHFAMEAGIKKEQGKTQVVRIIMLSFLIKGSLWSVYFLEYIPSIHRTNIIQYMPRGSFLEVYHFK